MADEGQTALVQQNATKILQNGSRSRERSEIIEIEVAPEMTVTPSNLLLSVLCMAITFGPFLVFLVYG